jgi:hypothetical protein
MRLLPSGSIIPPDAAFGDFDMMGNAPMESNITEQKKATWRWIAALSAISLATFLAPNILSSLATFTIGIDGQIRAHIVLGRTLHGLMLAWLLVFVGMCVRHGWKTLWCLPLISLLYIAQAKWDSSFCC